MAGGTITRIALGKSTTEIEEDFEGFYQNLSMSSDGHSSFNAKTTNYGTPSKSSNAGKYFMRGWWTDENDKDIKEALIGQKVKFHIQMDKTKVPAGSKIEFTLKDWDGMANPDDPITLSSSKIDPKTNTYPEVKELYTDANGKASITIKLTDKLVEYIDDDDGSEIELYFECTYYDASDNETEKIDLPEEEFNYLIVYEKEVLITVIVELPHSSFTLLNDPMGALGLAGHSAMAIGDRYFDYGPDYYTPTISEKEYDYDFNDDGDKDDTVFITSKLIQNKSGSYTGDREQAMIDDKGQKIRSIDYDFAPGRPWWGEFVAKRIGIKAHEVKLSQVLNYINLHWKGSYDPINGGYPDATYIFGEVHKIEFYARESEANKILKWWEERYKHLKVYSTYPWTGEQCTTTVKTAIQQAYSNSFTKVKNRISDDTQRPIGLLGELKKFVSTSKQHFNQPANNSIIKVESNDYP